VQYWGRPWSPNPRGGLLKGLEDGEKKSTELTTKHGPKKGDLLLKKEKKPSRNMGRGGKKNLPKSSKSRGWGGGRGK